MTAINFPAAPATGATHTEAGITWTFDGTVWDATGVGYVSKAGDTMTGNLTVPSLNGGQLAGFRNILINGNLKINQRGVTIAAAAVGAYGPDRWKKVDAGNMTQIVEDGNFVPGATYTLSGTGVTTQQLTAPASGHWTLPNIPIAATNIQLEQGTVATPFERRNYGQELVLCQRYFQILKAVRNGPYFTFAAFITTAVRCVLRYSTMRASPAITLSAANTFIVQTNGGSNVTPTAIGAALITDHSALVDFICTVPAGDVAGTILDASNNSGILISAEL